MILIGTICQKLIYSKTALAIINVVKQTPADVSMMEGIYVHENRNGLAQFTLDNGYSHLFFVDSDMVFPPDTLDRLLAHDKDIVHGKYNYRYEPRTPMVFGFGDNGMKMVSDKEMPKELFKVAGVPTGCTLIKASVFEKLTKPYFFFDYTADGRMENSEDVYFSRKCAEAGIEMWCDPTIEIDHIGDYFY